MRKKTAPKPRQHRPASPTQQSGLIAQGRDAQQSATRNCALDNRSHRTQPGPLQDWYQGLIARGMREELARVTLTRKLAAITLRLWKKGERYDPTQLTIQAR